MSVSIRVFLVGFLLTPLGFGSFPANAKSPQAVTLQVATPEAVVTDLLDGIIDIMQRATDLGQKGRADEMEPIIEGTFDVEYLSALTAGRVRWRDWSEAERKSYRSTLARYVAATYAVRFRGYSGETFHIKDTQEKEENKVLVLCAFLKGSGEPVDISYYVYLPDGSKSWSIRDVFLNGTISEFATWKGEFASTLRKGGHAGIIAALNSKISELEADG